MGQKLPLNIIGGAYADDTRAWSDQECVNLLPVIAERGGTRTPTMLRQVPGMYLYKTLGDGPIRGLHDVEGTLYVVSGDSLYSIGSDRTTNLIGTIGGVSRVSMAHNQITAGNQLVIAAGTTGYVYDSAADTLETITDEAFIGASSVDFVDGYITFVESGGRFWGHSELADAKNYTSLDRYEGETAPDKIVTHIVLRREVILFSQRTIEVFADTGAAEGTFQRVNGVSIDIGCASKFSPARVAGTVAFLGNDGIVYAMDGYTPVRISTYAIEQAIADCDKSKAFGYAWEDQGHRVYYLTFPDGYTWGYDFVTKEWHRRESFGLNRWRANALVRWNNLFIAGDYASGNLYVLDWGLSVDQVTTDSTSSDPLRRYRRGSMVSANQKRVFCAEVEVVAEVGNEVPDPADTAYPTITGHMPDGYVGDTVSYQYTASGGTAPLTVTNSGLPTGTTADATGLATGVYDAAGTYTPLLTVTDSVGKYDKLRDKVVVSPGPAAFVATADGNISKADNGLLSNWTIKHNSGGDMRAMGMYGQTIVAMYSTLAKASVSLDDGETWNDYATGIASIVGTAPTDICYSSTWGKWYVIGQVSGSPNPGKVYSSADNGQTWVDITPAGLLVPMSIAENGSGRIVIITGTLGSGTYVSTDGASFTKTNTSKDQRVVRWFSSEFIAGRTTSGFNYSADGTAWTARAASSITYPYSIAGTSTYLMLAGVQNATYEISRSTDAGATQTGIYSGSATSLNPCSMAVYDRRVIVGRSAGDVLLSFDSGQTFAVQALSGTSGTASSVLLRAPLA